MVGHAIVVSSRASIWRIHIVIIACSVRLRVVSDTNNVISGAAEGVTLIQMMSIMAVNELRLCVFQWSVKDAFLRRCTSLDVVDGLEPS